MIHDITFKSFNERDTVFAWIYAPIVEPVGIVQIIHGFGEHHRRYLHMITTLLENGYIVAANDRIGHGVTARENDSWGDWGDKGWHTMTEDEHKLSTIVKEKYPGLPLFLFGQSMGSFISKDYTTLYGKELAGVILSGTAGYFPTAEAVGEKVQKLIDAGKGNEFDGTGDLLGELNGWLYGRFKTVTTGTEILTCDPDVDKDYCNDPLVALTKPVNNYAVLYFTELYKNNYGKAWAERVPAGLPFFFLGGDRDSQHNYGQELYGLANELIPTGNPCRVKLYNGYVHELHSAKKGKFLLEADVLEFLDYIALEKDPEDEVPFLNTSENC